MPRTMLEVHATGEHDLYPRRRCPLCKLKAFRAAVDKFAAAALPEILDTVKACDACGLPISDPVHRGFGPCGSRRRATANRTTKTGG